MPSICEYDKYITHPTLFSENLFIGELSSIKIIYLFEN